MGVNLAVTGINHEPFVVGVNDKLFQKRFPNTLIAPTAKTSMGVFPSAIGGRQVAPRCARAENPEHGVNKLPVICRHPAPNACAPRKMGLKYFPVPV